MDPELQRQAAEMFALLVKDGMREDSAATQANKWLATQSAIRSFSPTARASTAVHTPPIAGNRPPGVVRAQPPGAVNAFGRGVVQGLTFETGDEISAGLRSLRAILPGGQTPGEAFDESIGPIRERNAQALRGHPVLSGGGRLLGAVGANLAAGMTGPGRLAFGVGKASLKRLAVLGAAEGGVAGFGAGEGNVVERLPDAAIGATIGAVAAPAVTQAFRSGKSALRDFAERSSRGGVEVGTYPPRQPAQLGPGTQEVDLAAGARRLQAGQPRLQAGQRRLGPGRAVDLEARVGEQRAPTVLPAGHALGTAGDRPAPAAATVAPRLAGNLDPAVATADEFAVFTAENPGGMPATSGVNVARREKLNATLGRMGIEFDPTVGRYNDAKTGKQLSEEGVFARLDENTGFEMARAMEQNSVLTERGLHNINTGTFVPGAPRAAGPGDTDITTVGDGPAFTSDLDFDLESPANRRFQEISGDAVRPLSRGDRGQVDEMIARIRGKGITDVEVNENLGRTVPNPAKPGKTKAAPFVAGRRNVTTTDVNRLRRIFAGASDEDRVVMMRSTSNAVEVARRYAQQPSVPHFEAMAMAGRAKRGWYRNSARAIRETFGEDAPRFAGLLASMSPQTSVEENLTIALRAWERWVNAGRPRTESGIRRAMLTTGGKEFEGRLSNAIRVLISENPVDVILSGPKVNSFNRNLGDPAYRELMETLMGVTLDTHMGKIARIPQSILGGGGLELKGGEVFTPRLAGRDLAQGGGKGGRKVVRELRESGITPAYVAYGARVREVADALSRRTGTRWTPREVQETVWSWIYALDQGAGQKGRAAKAGGLTELLDDVEGHIAGVPAFDELFAQPRYAGFLRDLELPLPTPQPTGPAPFAEIPNQRKLLGDMARNIEQSARENFFPLVAFMLAGGAAGKLTQGTDLEANARRNQSERQR